MVNYKEMDKQYIANTYSRFDVLFTEGHGCILLDDSGKEYIDMASGIGVTSLGHGHQEWLAAVSNQAATLAHTSNLYYTKPAIDLAFALCEKTGYKKVFFANSGAEANEGMIKACRKYSFDAYGEGRSTIISLVNSFHGRTVTTLSATGQDVFHRNFHPFTPGFVFAEANNKEALLSLVDNSVCGILLEIVQGEGGVNTLDADYIAFVQELCKSKDILLLVDEVQTGVGRCGKFLSSGGIGNITSLAKGLGNGLPIGAVLFDEKTEKVLGFGDHGSTFGGNPIVCAGALVVVNAMTDSFLKEISEKGMYLRNKIEKIEGVKGTSGLGLMVGISLKDGIDNKKVINSCLNYGVVVLSAKEKIRLLPPLVISYEEIDAAVDVIARCIKESV